MAAQTRTAMQRAILSLWILSALPLILGFLGALHPVGDSMAVFRPPFTVAFTVASLLALLFRIRIGWIGICAAILCALGMIGYSNLLNISWDEDFSVYQKNLNFRLPDTGPVVADIIATGAGAVTLQEVPDRLLPILDALSETYPHSAVCDFHPRVGGVAILTKAPIEERLCLDGQGFLAVRVIAPDGLPLWIVSIHMHWPYPYRQAEQLERILPVLEGLDGRVVIGGDFNMPPWGHSVRQIRDATRTARTWSPLSTFPRFQPLAPMPIDQVFAPGGGSLEKRGLLGSDHHGILARVGF